jgi:DNA-directed RNA polymerase subunit RPC12/RpoP
MILSIVIAVLFLIAALPLKNWLEIRGIKAEDDKWSAWLSEKPSREEYCHKTNQNIDDIKCDYCGSNRQNSNMLMAIPYKPQFGIISNTFNKDSYFKTYLCSQCGTQLYRERYEA